MKIIITGGTGLIGRSLAADLAQKGHDVIVLSRNPKEADTLPAQCPRDQVEWPHRRRLV